MPSWSRCIVHFVKEIMKDAQAIRKEIMLIQKLVEDLFVKRNSLV